MRQDMRAVCVLVLMVAMVLSFANPSAETQKSLLLHLSESESAQQKDNLQYDFYRETCPEAAQLIRSTITELYQANPTISPRLLRLFFHDCFIQGCDASVLLMDPSSSDTGDNMTEKDAIPNQTLKALDKIDIVKARLEQVCPRTVSCADTLALAARDAIVLAGGSFYPLLTGRTDSVVSFYSNVSRGGIPGPDDDIDTTLASFAGKGFNERETVSLLGAHSIGTIDCQFISKRLNFRGTGLPDPSMPLDLANQLREKCIDGIRNGSFSHSTMGISYYQALSPAMPSGAGFDTHYYKSLLSGRGLLFADQQLMAIQKTASLVRAYASDDGSAFRREFARAMVKLSSLSGTSSYQGRVRVNCSKLPHDSG